MARANHSLDRSALRGVAWSGAAKWSTQIFAWVGTILVARILTPEDIGLLTVASVFMGVVMVLSESGIGTTVVTLRELPPAELRQLNAFAVYLGAGGSALAAAMAYPLGAFFRSPELPPVLALVGLTFFIKGCHTVPGALLRRELRFRTLATIDVVRGLAVPVVTLVGALAGLRYWALAIGSVAGALIAAAMTLGHRRVGFARPTSAGLKPALTYSVHVMVSRLGYVVYQSGDFAVAGRRLSMGSVGDYGMAWTLATSPIEKVSMVLADVMPTLFSATQHDRVALRRYFLNLTELIALATFPAAVGLSLVSGDLVAVVLGSKWAGAVAPMTLLALYAGVRSVSTLHGHLFNAVRETRFAMWTALALAAMLLTGFVVGSRWGAVGIAAAWVIVHPAMVAYSFTRVSRVLDLPVAGYIRAMRPALDGTAVMAITVALFQRVLAPTWSPAVKLPVAIVLGGVTFVSAVMLFHGARVRTILAWIRRVRGGGSPDPVA